MIHQNFALVTRIPVTLRQQLNIRRNGVVSFRTVTEEATCEVDLLSEVGEPFQPEFEEFIRRTRMEMVVEERDGYYATYLTGETYGYFMKKVEIIQTLREIRATGKSVDPTLEDLADMI